jgi:hypothetical protein
MFKKASIGVMLSVFLWIPMIDIGMADGTRTKRYLTNKTFVSKTECERGLQGLVNLMENMQIKVYQAKCVRK